MTTTTTRPEQDTPSTGAGEYELKYVFPNAVALDLIRWLGLRCEPDPLYPRGTVSSVYYDTFQWALLNEKINSDYLKTKARVRWYSDVAGKRFSPSAWLEAKFKIGSRRDKRRIELAIDGRRLSREPLESQFWLDLITDITRLEVALPGPLLPVFEIRYNRFRYVEPTTRTRICIDVNISARRPNSLLIQPVPPAVLDQGVFEFKGSRPVLPPFLHQMTVLGCRKGSFSKYLNCYMALAGEIG
jgi:hypothetical protein